MVYHKQNADGGKRPDRFQWIPAAGLVIAIIRLLVDVRSHW
jgi:hypothetical protein